MAMNSGTSKFWNNRDKLLKKFIGGSPNGEIEMGVETQSGHEGPKLSMEAQRRLEFVEELLKCITNGHLLFVMDALILQRVQKYEVR